MSVGADVGWPLTDFFENVLLWTAGAASSTTSSPTERPPGIPMRSRPRFETMAELWQEDWVVGGLQGLASVTFTESATQLVTEPAGFMFEGDFVAGQITVQEVGEIGTDADFVPFPAIGDGTAGENVIVGGDFPVLLNDSKAGQALMAYLASAEAQEIWVTEGGFLRRTPPWTVCAPRRRDPSGRRAGPGSRVDPVRSQRPRAARASATEGQGPRSSPTSCRTLTTWTAPRPPSRPRPTDPVCGDMSTPGR